MSTVSKALSLGLWDCGGWRGCAGGWLMAVGRARQSDIALKNEENRFINKKVSNLRFK